MPRGRLDKSSILSRVYKLKNSLYDEESASKNKDWYSGAHYSLNKILDVLNEYSN